MTHLTLVPEPARVSPSVGRLSSAGGYTYSLFDASSRIDSQVLGKLTARAFGQDYSARAVFRFDAAYLDWLLEGEHWFGIQVRDRTGHLVGCEVALERAVLWEGRPLRSYFVTLLSVDPAHRGRGLAQRILRHLTEEALERRRAHLLVSCFDGGAAGRPTVEKMVAETGGALALRLSPVLGLWSCTADLRAVDRYEPFQGPYRLALWPGVRSLLEYKPGRSGGPEPELGCLSDTRREQSRGFAFAPAPALGSMYRCRDDGRSGTLRFRFGPDTAVTVAWHVAILAKPGLPDQPFGSVQMVQPENASAAQVVRALRKVNDLLLRQGCLGTTILDSGVLAHSTLWRAGFRPTPRGIRVAMRGPAAILGRLPALRGPFAVDLL